MRFQVHCHEGIGSCMRSYSGECPQNSVDRAHLLHDCRIDGAWQEVGGQGLYLAALRKYRIDEILCQLPRAHVLWRFMAV